MQRSSRLALALAAAVVAGGVVVQSLADVGSGPTANGPEDHHLRFSPQQICVEQYARKAGHLAYLEARLELNPEQQALWDKWSQASTAGAEKLRAACLAAAPKADSKFTALDREALAETMLSLKVDNLKAARPALESLYAALSPEQQAVFDRAAEKHRGDGGHHRWHGGDGEWGGHGDL
jgi:hypothetical protein